MDWSICPLCGYDSSPGGGCYCWEDAPPAEGGSPEVGEPRPDEACPGLPNREDGPDV